MPAVTYGLLEYYNDLQSDRGIGEAMDLKFVHIMLKGFFGLEKMSEMDEINFNDPMIMLAQRKTFFAYQLRMNKINQQLICLFINTLCFFS